MDGTTAYRVLGVGPAASRSAIRASYRRLAKQHHPDRGGSPASFQILHEAYRVAVAASPTTPPPAARRFFTVTSTPAPPRPRPQRSFAEELRLAMGI